MKYKDAVTAICRYGIAQNGERQVVVGIAYDHATKQAVAVADDHCWTLGGGIVQSDDGYHSPRRVFTYQDPAEMAYHFDNHRRSHFPEIIREASGDEALSLCLALSGVNQ